MNRVGIFQVHQMSTDTLRSADWGVQKELRTRLDIRRFFPFRRSTRMTIMEIQ